MTSRQLYEAVLIELNKENAPNIILEDFNYFVNKAINQYINKRYNIYDVNQQTTDDLRVLKATAKLDVVKINDYNDLSLASNATYEAILPSDYLHILNCICIYNVQKTYKCYNKGDKWRCAAKRLTADAYSQVLDNFWNKPTYKRPYYYIHNININSVNPTNPYGDGDNGLPSGKGTDISKVESRKVSENVEEKDYDNHPIPQDWKGINTISLRPQNSEESKEYSNIQKAAGIRYGNVSQVRMEIRYGTDDSIFELEKVYIDYIKSPQYIRLTQKQLDFTEDNSQMLEFPDYVCQEIVNELVHIIMENIGDPKLQTHPVVSQSIANPTQAQTPEAAG